MAARNPTTVNRFAGRFLHPEMAGCGRKSKAGKALGGSVEDRTRFLTHPSSRPVEKLTPAQKRLNTTLGERLSGEG
jgi:hypothetical protein